MVTNIDFTKGFDFTGVPTLIAADLNTLVEQATPYEEAGGNSRWGKGLTISTVDGALNTPDVPGADAVLKWKRYIWIRHPYPSAASTTPILYVWNENAVSDVTYLKWQLAGDVTALQAAIAAAQADIVALQVAQSNFTSQLNSASNIANQAAADVATLQGQIPDISNLNQAVFTDLPAANASNAAAAANALTVANVAQATATAAAANAGAVAAANFYTSAEISVSAAGYTNVAHLLTTVPKFARVVLVCKTDEYGYVANDEVDISSITASFATVSYSATKLTVQFQDVLPSIYVNRLDTTPPFNNNKGERVAITPGNWKLKVYLWK